MRRFYEEAMDDKEIGFIFRDIAKLDLEEHLPVISDFWENVLLGAGKYNGNPILKHLELHRLTEGGLTKEHFDRWLQIFVDVLRTHYRGRIADEAARKASTIAKTLHAKITQRTNSTCS